MTRLCLTVPMLPPSVNHMYQLCHGGRRALSPTAQTWRQAAGLLAREAAQAQAFALDDRSRLAVRIALTFPTRRKTDLDNFAKATIDAVALALGFDDARIDRLTLERAPRGPAQTVITLEAL